MKYHSFILLLLVLGACGDNAKEAAPEGGPEENDEELIHLTSAQVEQAKLAYGGFTQKNMPDELAVSGELTVHPEHVAQVTAFSDGVITELRVVLNQQVKKGQVVAVMRKPDLLDMQQAFLENKDQLVFLQAEHDRYRSLRDADATATRNYQKAAAELQAALTTSQVLAAKLRQHQIDPDKLAPGNLSTQLVLTAPVNGMVTAIVSNVGAAVQPGTPVCEVTDLGQLHADLWVFEKDLSKVKTGQKVNLFFSGENARTCPATIYSLDKVLDPERRALRAHARLGDCSMGQAHLVSGAFLDARIAVTETTISDCLPEAAIVQEMDGHFIFLLEKEEDDGRYFKKIEVETGGTFDGCVSVRPLSPLPTGAKIVVQGAYYVSAQGTGIEVEE